MKFRNKLPLCLGIILACNTISAYGSFVDDEEQPRRVRGSEKRIKELIAEYHRDKKVVPTLPVGSKNQLTSRPSKTT
jgi:hypothetical protein